MPDKVNENINSRKINIASLNASYTSFEPKSDLHLSERDSKSTTLQKMADDSPYSQRFAHLTSMANNSIQKQPVSQLSKDSHSLPDNVKQGVESLSGISMDDVKVHYNSDKPAQLNAYAYAQGTDIHIASGQEKHLPHEAWHVVQQKQGRVQPTTMMKAKVLINDDQGLEKEADIMGAKALQMKPFSLSDYKTEKSVQRKEIIQKEHDFAYPEKEKPEKTVGELISNFAGKAPTSTENVVPQNGNPISSQPEKEVPTKKIKDITNKIIALSKNIEKFKPKKEEEAKKAEAEEALQRAANAAAIAEEAEVLRVAAIAEEARVKAEEDRKKAEDDRVKAENAVLQAIKAADIASEEAISKTTGFKMEENFGGDSILGAATEIAGAPGQYMDTVAEFMEKGSENQELLKDNVTKGAFVSNLADTCELLSTAGNFFNSEKKPADFALLGATVVKFTTGVVDTINTYMGGELIGEALTETVTLLPGIKAGLGAFKNVVEGYQTNLKRLAINELLEKSDTLTKENIEVIEKYRTAIKWKLGEISVDFILNAAEAAAMFFPPAQVGIALLHASINLFKLGAKRYIDYKDNQELKRSERIGDEDVEKLKADNILEKSERNEFINALKSLSKLEHYKKDPVTNADAINKEELTLKNAIKIVNDSSLGEKIDENNLVYFLKLERLTILSIKKEVAAEKSLTTRFFNIFKLPQKETIIADLIKKGAINFDKIDEADINNLDPAASKYFFDKTRDAIQVACNRKHISANERLNMLTEMLLTKHDDYVIRGYMIDKYKDTNIYNDEDSDKIKFTRSVNRFKLDMKL